MRALKVETALIYDAMELFALALHQPSEMTQGIRPESLNCDAASIYPWSQGIYFMDALKQVTSSYWKRLGIMVIWLPSCFLKFKINFQGLSGEIHIDPDGKRRKFKLDVVELSNKVRRFAQVYFNVKVYRD